MSTLTKRLLLGSGAALLCAVLTTIVFQVLFDDTDRGPGATTMWLAGSLFEVATLALLIAAGVSFLVHRVRSSS